MAILSIKEFDDTLYVQLKVRAAMAGITLKEYLHRELANVVKASPLPPKS